jgi:hypothetical protein
MILPKTLDQGGRRGRYHEKCSDKDFFVKLHVPKRGVQEKWSLLSNKRITK